MFIFAQLKVSVHEPLIFCDCSSRIACGICSRGTCIIGLSSTGMKSKLRSIPRAPIMATVPSPAYAGAYSAPNGKPGPASYNTFSKVGSVRSLSVRREYCPCTRTNTIFCPFPTKQASDAPVYTSGENEPECVSKTRTRCVRSLHVSMVSDTAK